MHAFYNTNLRETLERFGVNTLIACMHTGVATNGCVESTIRSAFCRDYDIILVKDCTASFDFGYGYDVFLAAIRNVEIHRGAVVSSSEVIKMIKEQK